MQRKPVGGDGTFDLASTIRLLDGTETKFGQSYVLSNKEEVIGNDESSTFCKPLFIALMIDRSHESYNDLFKKLCELYQEECPTEGALEPSEFIMDFERACVKSVKWMWPKMKIKFCAFHLEQCFSRNMQRLYKTTKLDDHIVTRSIKKLLLGVPFVRWTPQLIKILFIEINRYASENLIEAAQNLKKEKNKTEKKKRHDEHKEAQEYCDATSNFVKYLEREFFNKKHAFGYPAWIQSVSADTYDYSNNQTETLNRLFGDSFDHRGPKTYVKACSIIYEFIGQFHMNKSVSEILYE